MAVHANAAKIPSFILASVVIVELREEWKGSYDNDNEVSWHSSSSSL